MPEGTVIYCGACGAPLEVLENRPYIFCRYCGCKNVIRNEQMKSTMNLGGVQIRANTNTENLIASAEYAIGIKQYDRANELLLASIMSGTNDYRVYILKAQIDLWTDDNNSLFQSLNTLRRLESTQSPNGEVTAAVRGLMHYRGINGVTALHNATFHELYDFVVYCVEHGSDVNCVAGMNMVTPISIMFVPVSPSLSRLDGTPFVRNKYEVKRIRDYLMAHGAFDRHRIGY
ncbi:MAG: hypothetical protein J5816_03070 [Clostridia bacterium]|nr:hypothetical protein [Clostridia bacterium]